jgi:hypothetical protein
MELTLSLAWQWWCVCMHTICFPYICVYVVCDRVLSVISVRRGCVTEGGVSTPTRAPVRWDLRCVWSVRETCGAMVDGCSSARSATTFFVKTTSLNTKPAVRKWSRRISNVPHVTDLVRTRACDVRCVSVTTTSRGRESST